MLILLYLLLMVAVSDELLECSNTRTATVIPENDSPSYRPRQVNSTFG
jgi:hypothetical protein